jgi:hypothetical protein
MGLEDVNQIHLAQDMKQCWTVANRVMKLQVS